MATGRMLDHTVPAGPSVAGDHPSMLPAALDYTSSGLAVVPVPYGQKAPIIKGWERLRLVREQLPTYFNGHPSNIGCVLGEASNGLVDVDIDVTEALTLAEGWLPPTGWISGRPGKRRSHHWYIASGAITRQYKDTDGTMLVELRSTGGQTLLPPSTHPSGERYAWESSGAPATSDPDALQHAVARLAAAAILARHYPKMGSRHAVSLALAGMLLRAGWSEDQTLAFVSGVATAAGDDEWHKRGRNVATTGDRLAEGTTATGAPTLATLLSDGDAVIAKVRAWLQLTSAGAVASAEKPSQLIATALATLGYRFAYNDVALTIEVNSRPISDPVEAEIRMRMRDAGFKNVNAITDVYTVLAHQNAYHPVRRYLDTLHWDGKNHIYELSRSFTNDDPAVTYANSQTRSLFFVYLYRWMIGAVAKVYAHEQNMMLVLAGPQGIGKSYLAQWLCSGLGREYFVASAIHPEDKDFTLRLAKTFMWEVEELDGTIRKADVAALKGFITLQEVVARPAYARRDVHAPALASMIGTVNPSGGFLRDASGNRRFYVAQISAIDWRYTELDVHQVWAQAVQAYRTGVAQGQQPWRLRPSEQAAQAEANRSHEARSLLDDWLDTDFSIDGAATTGMTAAEMSDHLKQRGHVLTGTAKAQHMEIAEALTRRGIGHARRVSNGQRRWYYPGVSKRED